MKPVGVGQWRTEGIWRPGRRWGLALLPLGVSDWQASKALSLAIGGFGVKPQLPTLLGTFGCKWNPFLNSIVRPNTIPNSACQTGKAGKHRKRSPSLLVGLGGAQPPTLLEAFGCEWNPFLNSVITPFPTRRVRLASAESALIRYFEAAEPQPPTPL